jgi:hypothetical protein
LKHNGITSEAQLASQRTFGLTIVATQNDGTIRLSNSRRSPEPLINPAPIASSRR